MINSVPITVVGNLTADPELRFTADGTAVAALSVAFNPRQYDRTAAAWKDGEPSYYRVTAWRQLAENVVESLHRGDRVVVTGTWHQRHWEDADGTKRDGWTLTADAVGVELSWATAQVRKLARSGRNEAPPDDAWSSASKTRPTAPDPASPVDEPPF
jgi:single-strand DNA-binding protein